MKKLTVLLAVAAFALLLALSCEQVITQDKPLEVKVDVNVRIDVYQHAVDVVDYISGESETLPDIEADTKSKPTGMLEKAIDLAFSVKTVYAAETSNNPYFKEIVQSMKKRYSEIQNYKQDGSMGENHKGLLSMRDSEKMKTDAAYAAKVEKLLKEENQDREQLYRLDAKLKNTPYEKIVKLYATLWADKAQKGQWIEVEKDGQWVWQEKK